MSPKRNRRASTTKRRGYRPPRDRRELWTAIAAAALIVIVTASLVWFVRPNRESTPSIPIATNPDPVINTTTTTVPADPSATTVPADTTAPTGG